MAKHEGFRILAKIIARVVYEKKFSAGVSRIR